MRVHRSDSITCRLPGNIFFKFVRVNFYRSHYCSLDYTRKIIGGHPFPIPRVFSYYYLRSIERVVCTPPPTRRFITATVFLPFHGRFCLNVKLPVPGVHLYIFLIFFPPSKVRGKTPTTHRNRLYAAIVPLDVYSSSFCPIRL